MLLPSFIRIIHWTVYITVCVKYMMRLRFDNTLLLILLLFFKIIIENCFQLTSYETAHILSNRDDILQTPAQIKNTNPYLKIEIGVSHTFSILSFHFPKLSCMLITQAYFAVAYSFLYRCNIVTKAMTPNTASKINAR